MNKEEQELINQQLRTAADCGDAQKITVLLDQGAQIETQLVQGQTPLYLAAKNGHNEACKVLIAAAANLQVKKTSAGWTPLTSAISNGHPDVCVTLIDAGAKGGEYVPGFPLSALSLAASKGMADICKRLIATGEDVNEVVWDGRTPLMQAAAKGHADVCRVLIEAGANVWAEDKNRLTALVYADTQDMNNINREAGMVLLRAGADSYQGTVQRWLYDMREHVKSVFSTDRAPAAAGCFSKGELSDDVLDACATDTFGTHVAEPLIKAKQYALFEQVWDALPEYWKEKNQGLYIGYAKREKAITPPIHSIEERRVEL